MELNPAGPSWPHGDRLLVRYAVLLRGTSNDASPDTVEPAQIDLIALTDSKVSSIHGEQELRDTTHSDS